MLEESLLVTLDVKSSDTNTTNDKGIKAVKESYEYGIYKSYYNFP